ncbi:MAG: hypothetical protein LC623_04480 [Halobacteriales archaeon]|nr:hypothetical protein [Halobacteriales archaeon]
MARAPLLLALGFALLALLPAAQALSQPDLTLQLPGTGLHCTLPTPDCLEDWEYWIATNGEINWLCEIGHAYGLTPSPCVK